MHMHQTIINSEVNSNYGITTQKESGKIFSPTGIPWSLGNESQCATNVPSHIKKCNGDKKELLQDNKPPWPVL